MLGEGTPVPDCRRGGWRVPGHENSRIAAHDHTCKGWDSVWTGLLGVPLQAFAETPVFAPKGNEGVVALRVPFRS